MPTLRSREDFARIGAHGRTRADRLMVVRFVPNALDYDRFGISTARRLGGAVQRNRVRRRIREALRHLERGGLPTMDVLIVMRPASVSASFAELRSSLEQQLLAARGAATKSAS